jgi:hypothetical protein
MGASASKCRRPGPPDPYRGQRGGLHPLKVGGGNSTGRRGRHGRDGHIGRRQPVTLPHLHRSALASHPVP